MNIITILYNILLPDSFYNFFKLIITMYYQIRMFKHSRPLQELPIIPSYDGFVTLFKALNKAYPKKDGYTYNCDRTYTSTGNGGNFTELLTVSTLNSLLQQ